ncbi:hypothetical protein ACKS0A_06223 [Histoplasma ohiense]
MVPPAVSAAQRLNFLETRPSLVRKMPFASSILAHKTDTNWITQGAKKKKKKGSWKKVRGPASLDFLSHIDNLAIRKGRKSLCTVLYHPLHDVQ